MSDSADTIEMKIHDITGRMLHVAMERSAMNQDVINRLNPLKLFTNEFLPIRFDNNLTVLPSATICEVELTGRDLPEWPYISGAVDVVEVRPEQFEGKYDVAQYAQQRKKAWDEPGADQVGFTEYVLVNGRHRIWEVRMKSLEVTASDMTLFITRLLEAGGLHAHTHDGGRIIINPKTIRRMSFYPGPSQPPKGTIVGRYLGSGKSL